MKCRRCGAELDIIKRKVSLSRKFTLPTRWVCYGCRIKEKCVISDDDGCWVWNGAARGKYGIIQITQGGKKLFRHAHRVAYAVWISAIPKSWAVEHSCGTKKCCNPAHLKMVQQPEKLGYGPFEMDFSSRRPFAEKQRY